MQGCDCLPCPRAFVGNEKQHKGVDMLRYRVGYAVRDRLLGLPVRKNEWVIVGVEAAWLTLQGFDALDTVRGLYRDPVTGEPCQLARREYRDRQSGETIIEISPEADLESELAVRDLTINAMALDDHQQLIDPFDGEEDLRDGTLRHVTPHFARHPEYLLNIGIEAAHLVKWGFHVAHGTHGLLKRMVADKTSKHLSAGQWASAVRALLSPDARPSEGFRIWQRCGALAVVSPQLGNLFIEGESHQNNLNVPAALTWLDQTVTQGHEREIILSGWRQQLGENDALIFQQLGL